MKISKNGAAIFVVLLGFLGLDVTDNQVLEFAGAVVQVISFGTLIYHQIVERWETFGFFFKK